MQAGRGEAILFVAITPHIAADLKRLVAQAMAILQQQQPLASQGGNRDARLCCQPVAFRQRHQELIARHGLDIGAAALAGQRQQQNVQLVGVQPFDQSRCRVLLQLQPQLRKPLAQRGHQPRQQERPDRRYYAQAQRPAHGRAGGGGHFGNRLQRCERRCGQRDQFQSERGENHVFAGAAVKDCGIQLTFQGQDAGRKRGLSHRAGQRGAAEMPALGQSGQVAKLLRTGQRGHRVPRSKRVNLFIGTD